MQSRIKVFALLIISLSIVLIPCTSIAALPSDDEKFLTAMQDEGVVLLFGIPATMNTGVFHGNDPAIQSIGQEQSAALDAFNAKINAYSLSPEVEEVRDQFISSSQIFKNDLAEYSTLSSTCGSCITTMNAMYPKLNEEAKKTLKKLIKYYQASATPIN